jgi:hypothetical protein
MKIKITMTIETTNNTFEDTVIPEEDNVARWIESQIDGSMGLKVIECDGREMHKE